MVRFLLRGPNLLPLVLLECRSPILSWSTAVYHSGLPIAATRTEGAAYGMGAKHVPCHFSARFSAFEFAAGHLAIRVS